MKMSSWPFFMSQRIFQKKKRRYILGMIALCFAYLTLWALHGLTKGLEEGMVKKVFQRMDAYRFSLSKKSDDQESYMGITKMESPTFEEAYSFKEYIPSLEVDYDVTYLIPNELKMKETSSFYHVELIDQNPFFKKKQNTIYINQLMLDRFKKEKVMVPFSFSYSVDIYTPKSSYYIHDTFEFNYEIQSFEVTNEYEFQNTATLYMPYQVIKTYLKNHYLKRLSLDQERVISYYDWLSELPSSSKERKTNLWLFVDNEKDAYQLIQLLEDVNSPYVLSSSVKENYTMLQSMSKVMKNLLFIVLWITLVILAILIGYLSYTHLLKDQQEIGVFFALGAKERETESVYQLLGVKMNLWSYLGTGILLNPFYFLISQMEKKVFHAAIFLFKMEIQTLLIFMLFTQLLYAFMIHISFFAYKKQEVENLLKEED